MYRVFNTYLSEYNFQFIKTNIVITKKKNDYGVY